MRTVNALLVAALISGVAGSVTGQDAQPEKTKAQDAKKTAPEPIYDENAKAEDQIAAALEKASKENRRVLIQWGANWCSWCHKLHDTFKKDAQVRRTLQYEYDVVLIDVGQFDKNIDLAEQYGAEFKSKGKGIPYLTILNADGKVIANQETGVLEKEINGKSGHDPKLVLDFLTENQAEYRHAESVLADGLIEARRQGKRVFLHFGAPWCGWCHRLENWMAREEIAGILEKDFVDVKIDTDRTIGGKDLHMKFTDGKSSGIPWFAVLDPEGEVIVDSFALPGDNNLGYPYTQEEVGIFRKLMAKAVQKITPEELDKLAESLHEVRQKAEAARGDDG